MRFSRILVAALATLTVFCCSSVAARAAGDVTRATLSNGLQVVVVRDTLAPVVTTMLNYKVGSNEQSIDGLAHATEHMMFRGSKTMSSSSLMETIGITGGNFNADTQNNVTQYFFTVPSQYLDIALRVERSRATGLLMTPDQWAQERGAITQEVTQDNSDAIYRLFVKMQNRLVGGTPYNKDGLGTVASFKNDVNSAQLLKFYHSWYHPNNAVYVIVGNVDGAQTIARVKQLFGDIPSAKLPARDPVHLEPLHAATYHETSDQPFTAVLLGYRLPGYDSPDYAATQILGDVLNNQRSTFGALPFTGKALGIEFDEQTFTKAGLGIAFAAVPVTSKPQDVDAEIRGIINDYRTNGVPADLVAAAKLREVSELEFNGNSIEGLANEWSQAVAVQGLGSPDDMIAHFRNVSVADVNRVLRKYLNNSTVVAAYAVPKNAGAASGGGSMAAENNSTPPSTHEPLPSWAQSILKNLRVPAQTIDPSDTRLSNGVRLIVQPETITHTVVVSGQIQNNTDVQEPAGQEGVGDVTAALLPYGTTSYDRVGLAAELDKIAATTTAGTSFGVRVLSQDFDRGVQLLADEELHPAFDPKSFGLVKDQSVGSLTGEMTSPDHLTDVALMSALYPPGDPSRRFATPQTVGALTLDQVKSWYGSAYRPDLTTIVVIGNTTPDKAKAVFEKYFSSWTAQGPKPNIEPPPVAANAPSQVTIPATGRVQSAVQLVETLPLLRTDPDWARLQLANTVLTGGFYSSMLYHDLREVHGYVYNVGSSVSAGKVRGTFTVRYGCDPKNIVPAEGQVVAILSQLQKTAIQPDRLLRSKALLMGDFPIRQSSYSGVARELLNYSALDLPLDQNVLDAQAELDATPDAVAAALAKFIRPNGFVRVVTGPGPR